MSASCCVQLCTREGATRKARQAKYPKRAPSPDEPDTPDAPVDKLAADAEPREKLDKEAFRLGGRVARLVAREDGDREDAVVLKAAALEVSGVMRGCVRQVFDGFRGGDGRTMFVYCCGWR